ncbi:hypothetical protein SY85_10065 [Flavisolibacter tropicus]|uniref:Peptidase C14 caspase domain-containing protein n=2 Tax=Flavisolibacter tropicus TaxID=1492898 RepID=A0A172TUX9_9BACT|nr:hypothetical protein SY85_10065 [Flavisolibacter tropicus]
MSNLEDSAGISKLLILFMRNVLTLFVVFSFLFSAAQGPMDLKFPVTPKGFYATVEFSNDGKLILFSEHQRTYLVDAVTYRTVYDFKNTTKSTFSPDGKYILITYSDKIEVWDIASQAFMYSTRVNSSGLTEAVLSADSKYLVMIVPKNSWPVQYELVTIDLSAKKELQRTEIINPNLKICNTATFNRIATFGLASKATIHNLQDGSPLFTIDLGDETINTLEFSPDDKWIVIATTGGKINIYDSKNGNLTQVIKAHKSSATSASFSNDGKSIVSSSLDSTIKIWKAGTGKLQKEFKEEEAVSKVYFSPKDNYVIASMNYNWLNIRNVATGKKHNPDLLSIMAYYSGPKSISPDEQLYYTQSKILKLSNAETVHEFQEEISALNTVETSPNGRYIATIKGLHSSINIWDMYTGKMVGDFGFPDSSRYVMFAQDLKFSGDSKSLFIGWNNGDLWQWDLEGAKVTKAVKAPTGLGKLEVNRSRKQLLCLSDSVLTAIDANSLKELFRFSADSFRFFTLDPAIYSPDESLLLLNGATKIMVVDSRTGQLIQTIKKERQVATPLITPDNKKLVVVYDDPSSYVYDLQTGRQLMELKHVWNSSQNAAEFLAQGAKIDPAGTYLQVFAVDKIVDNRNYLQFWDLSTGKKVQSVPFPSFTSLYDGSSFYLTSTADSIRLHDHNSLKVLATVAGEKMQVDSLNKRIIVQTEYAVEFYSYDLKKQLAIASFGKGGLTERFISSGGIIVLPNNYYKADPDAVSKIHFQKGLSVFAVNQLDVELNRPDKVLQVLGSNDTSLITAYKNAYEKRKKKLALSDDVYAHNSTVPVAEIVNRYKIPSEQLEKTIQLNIYAADSTVGLDRYNVWVNEVPLFGVKGAAISKAKAKKFESTLTVPLSNGTNRIEFAVINKAGKESYRQPVSVYQGSKKTLEQTHGYQAYDPKATKEGTVYFIGIGIDKFKEAEHNLQWSVKDVRDLAENLSTMYYNYNFVVDTLFNENVTVANITSLKNRLQNTTVNDRVVLSYSGHGLLSKDYDYYLSSYNVNFQKPEEGGLPYDVLESLLDSIPARKKLMLIDACHSGEVDKEELQKIAQVNNEAEKTNGAKGGTPLVLETKKTGMKSSFELMQELFVNVGRSTGATIISAAAGTQFALERNDLQNGVFTYSILEFMKSHSSATVGELKRYVNKRVPELTKGLQVPTARAETKTSDWNIW